MQVISSKDNEIVKNIKKLKEKKYRDITNEFIVEGVKLLKEAIIEGAKIHKIVICEECVEDGDIDQKLLYEIAKYDCIYVTQKVFESITDVTNPQGILSVIEKRNSELEIDFSEDLIVVLDGIRDPGNLGTILRTIDSAGLKQIIVSKQTADCFNPKVVRSTMGAIFRVKIIESDNLIETLKQMQKRGFKTMATSLEATKTIYEVNYNKKAIIIGNEANGISKEIIELADEKVKIPMLRQNRKPECLHSSGNSDLRIRKAKNWGLTLVRHFCRSWDRS